MGDKTKKTKRKNEEQASSSTENKKQRLFSVKEFRKKLNSVEERLTALREFLQQLNDPQYQHCVLEYLETGGNCIELLQTTENNADPPHVLIFEIVNIILLNIVGKYPQFSNLAHDTGRHILNTYTTLINKMLGLSSSAEERLIVLKLLTTITTLSAVLAKDILLHINFHQTNLELLTKITERNSEIRDAFIHFLTAFLVSGQYPTLSILLEKRGLITSIIGGLQYDEANTVCLVLTSMRNHILENPQVSKTVKMKTFSTPVVKTIVNLYNWKGPGAVPSINQTNTVIVDQLEKSKVNEAVHSFLLVLCTSHKFGIIFKDPQLGLGKKCQNSLMLTVLESLERPWEHSYAGELVIKICAACPDLVKTVWVNLKQFLEPRLTDKWLNTVKFVERLLDELKPDCVEFFAKDLTEYQLSQIVTTLVMPLPIIKTIISENAPEQSVRYYIIKLLLKMLKSAENYCSSIKIWLKDKNKFEKSIKIHVGRNFPDAAFILNNCFAIDDKADYLNVAFNLLEFYKKFAYHLLDPITNLIDVEDFLSKITDEIQIDCLNFFIDFQPILFGIKTNLFKFSINLLFLKYASNPNLTSFNVLFKLLKRTNVFDKDIEINFWINGVLNVDYDESVGDFIVETLRNLNCNDKPIKTALDNSDKKLRKYFEFVLLHLFHTQSDLEIFENFDRIKHLNKYFAHWRSGNVEILKTKGKIEVFSKCSEAFLAENEEIFTNFLKTENLDLYPDCKLNLLQQIIFYFTSLIKNDKITEIYYKNCDSFVKFLNISDFNNYYFDAIFNNPILVKNLSLVDLNHSTRFIINAVKLLKDILPDEYLQLHRNKLFKSITKILIKLNTSSYNGLLDVVNLNEDQSLEIINKFPSLSETNLLLTKIITHCLNQIHINGLHLDVVNKIVNYFILLFNSQDNNSTQAAESLLNYLKQNKNQIENIPENLVNSLMNFPEYNLNLVALTCFLLENNKNYLSCIEENLEKICEKKGVVLSILNVAVKQNCDDEILRKIYNKFEGNILKAIQKPQKAGQYFHAFHESIGVLIEKFMPADKYQIEKVHKFETSEIFHANLLRKIFNKYDKNKYLTNMVMTYVHLLINLLKTRKDVEKLLKIGEIFFYFLDDLLLGADEVAFTKNESFNLFCKLLLKYGISGDYILIKILIKLLNIIVFTEAEAKLILDLMLSHSEFLNVVLSDADEGKLETLSLFSVLCTKWPQFLERGHVPIILASYRATLRTSDKILLDLLKRCEENAGQTNFFDFKPFLWGRAAASHYSVRTDIQKALWRQPKMGDVLNILQDNYVLSTITNFAHPDDTLVSTVYDLTFLLPLFSQLLAPQNAVQTYKFSKSGALSLTIIALSSNDKDCRLAACHVLSRFHYHQEARQAGKDNPLWVRFIEAICKGVANIEEVKLNNFAAIYLARMALILTQPNHVMYVPLAQYLSAKSVLDFSTIPELYTFLNSSDVNHQEHRLFILEIIKDGLKTGKDFSVFMHSMAFKLLSGLVTSSICDNETKLLILEIFYRCTKIQVAPKLLCENYSFLTQIYLLLKNSQKTQKDCTHIINKLRLTLQII